jgi:hypothetical protein
MKFMRLVSGNVDISFNLPSKFERMNVKDITWSHVQLLITEQIEKVYKRRAHQDNLPEWGITGQLFIAGRSVGHIPMIPHLYDAGQHSAARFLEMDLNDSSPYIKLFYAMVCNAYNFDYEPTK